MHSEEREYSAWCIYIVFRSLTAVVCMYEQLLNVKEWQTFLQNCPFVLDRGKSNRHVGVKIMKFHFWVHYACNKYTKANKQCSRVTHYLSLGSRMQQDRKTQHNNSAKSKLFKNKQLQRVCCSCYKSDETQHKKPIYFL